MRSPRSAEDPQTLSSLATSDSLDAGVGRFVHVVLVEAVSSLAQLVVGRQLARWRVATATSVSTINPQGLKKKKKTHNRALNTIMLHDTVVSIDNVSLLYILDSKTLCVMCSDRTNVAKGG